MKTLTKRKSKKNPPPQKKILELNTRTEMKNSLEGFKGGSEQKEKRISELEDRTMKINHSERKTEEKQTQPKGPVDTIEQIYVRTTSGVPNAPPPRPHSMR